MKRSHLVLAASLAALLAAAGCSQPAATPTPAVSASASPDGEGQHKHRHHKDGEQGGDHHGEGHRGERYKKMFEEMDTNHDGKLSDEERSAGLDKLLEKNERMRDRVDTNGDGKISPEEKAEFLKTFMVRKPGEGHRRDQSASASASPSPSDEKTPSDE